MSVVVLGAFPYHGILKHRIVAHNVSLLSCFFIPFNSVLFKTCCSRGSCWNCGNTASGFDCCEYLCMQEKKVKMFTYCDIIVECE